MGVPGKIHSVNNFVKQPVLLYFYLSPSSFVNNDIDTLKTEYEVKLFLFEFKNKALVPISFLRQKLFLIRNIFSCSILVCQFSGYHSLLPVLFGKLFHKPCLLIVGGTDCTSFPSINYGNMRKQLLRFFTLKSLKYATHILSPSLSLVESDYTYSQIGYPKQGYRYFDKSITTPYSVIFNGVDVLHFAPVGKLARKEKSFLTICSTIDKRNFYLKGLDLIISAAKELPDCEFSIIGRFSPSFNIETSDNVKFIDYISHDLLPETMAEFNFYCQLSLSEGFGLALAESMACGCVPIVSKVGIMDFIVGDSGFVLEHNDIGQLLELIKKALESDIEALGKRARARIENNFDLNTRRLALLKIVNDLCK
jgi:glycosyltransferase involved in cell wall biosynthesis